MPNEGIPFIHHPLGYRFPDILYKAYNGIKCIMDSIDDMLKYVTMLIQILKKLNDFINASLPSASDILPSILKPLTYTSPDILNILPSILEPVPYGAKRACNSIFCICESIAKPFAYPAEYILYVLLNASEFIRSAFSHFVHFAFCVFAHLDVLLFYLFCCIFRMSYLCKLYFKSMPLCSISCSA